MLFTQLKNPFCVAVAGLTGLALEQVAELKGFTKHLCKTYI